MGGPQQYEAVSDVYLDWMQAVKAGDPAKVASGPDFYGPCLENVIPGMVACQTRKPGKKLRHDRNTVRITNDDDADKFIRRQYRKGFDNWISA